MITYNFTRIALLVILFSFSVPIKNFGQKKTITIKATHKSERIWDEETKDWKSYFEEDVDATILWIGEKVTINEKGLKQKFTLGTGNTKSTEVADFSIMNCKDANGNNCIFSLMLNKIKELNCVEIINNHHSDRYYFYYDGMVIKNEKQPK